MSSSVFRLVIIMAVAACFFAAAPGEAACPAYTFTKIAGTDTIVPGGNGGNFTAATFNGDVYLSGGEAAFLGSDGSAQAIFTGNGQSLVRRVSIGDTIPAVGQITGFPPSFDMDTYNGTMLFLGEVDGSRSIVGWDLGGLSVYMQPGDAAPTGTYSLPSFVGLDGTFIAFQAQRVLDPIGLFAGMVLPFTLVADLDTALPGGVGTFSSFASADPAVSGFNLAFLAGRSLGGTGIYARLGGVLTRIADVSQTPSGSSSPFTTFGMPDITGASVAFFGLTNTSAIYRGSGGALEVVVQSGDPAPGGGTFSGFGVNVCSNAGNLAYQGSGSGFQGIFLDLAGNPCRLIDVNDTLDGKDITSLSLNRDGLSGDNIAFSVTFSDLSRAFYLATPVNICPGMILLMLLN